MDQKKDITFKEKLESIGDEPELEQEEPYLVNIQLAENENTEIIEDDENANIFEAKRKLLDKTKISKQTWSILEIYQKIRSKKLLLDTEYQRNYIWPKDKRTAFIESLFMGIIIPPIYVVEIPGQDFLEENLYEVVDGKQRITTLKKFIDNEFKLDTRSLEYYQDWFASKTFDEIKEQHDTLITEMLSSVLDIYVITANSPEFTKYDIFSRLNKGSEKLKVNEIRKAIYRSEILNQVDIFVQDLMGTALYKKLFSRNDIKRYEDYGRFYRSIAYYVQTNIEEGLVIGYNSRLREMINDVLSRFQNKNLSLEVSKVESILKNTIQLLLKFEEQEQKSYLVDMCIYFAVEDYSKLETKFDTILSDPVIKETFEKSIATTSNVNKRLERMIEIMSV